MCKYKQSKSQSQGVPKDFLKFLLPKSGQTDSHFKGLPDVQFFEKN